MDKCRIHKKIKILHVVYSFGIGGLEKGIATLINNASSEFEHEILCLTCSGGSRALLNKAVPIHEMHKLAGNSLSFLFKLIVTIRAIKPDIVHTRNWSGLDAVIAARLAGGASVVHGEHGWGMDDPTGQSEKRKKIRRYLSLLINEFTAVSCQIRDWLAIEVCVRAPVTQIYNGMDIGRYSVNSNSLNLHKELALPKSAILIGIVARLDPIKDHAGLLEAFKIVRNQYKESHLVIIGDGPEMDRLKTLAVKGVHFLGMRTDVPEILNCLDVFVLNSLNEGISNTILEAMATGLPVVATAVGGTPELIIDGYNGQLVPPESPRDVARCLLRYLNEPKLCAEHGRLNRQIIAEKFSVSAMVSGYEDVWRRVSSPKG